MAETLHLKSLRDITTHLFDKVGPHLNLGCPLGLGKPNHLINAIYEIVKNDLSKTLHIYSALSLQLPKPKSDLEQRFLGPFLKRHFGNAYPELTYTIDQKKQILPKNIKVIEFYLQSGSMMGIRNAQENYINLNYTHVAQTLFERDVHAVVQMIAARTIQGKTTYSLSSNPDLTLDLYDIYKKNHKKLILIGVVHPDLPYLGGDAEVTEDFFDVISETEPHTLFSLPIQPIDYEDHAIGFQASQLIKDDGTLQIGIGSLSDALVHSSILRHKDNDTYKKLIAMFPVQNPSAKSETSIFEKGLYGTSEMIMDGFMHLRQAGILKREVIDQHETNKRFLHGAFFLGSKKFYDWLRNLPVSEYNGIAMTKVSKVNDLYDENEMAIRRQRKNARFFNTCMQVSLLGGAASDTLPSGQVVSGIGGQYNFVAMSHELPDSYSVLMLRSTRTINGKRTSNIIWSHGHLSIPRHLRDVVITEYGIAYLRGKTDEETIKALLNITDSEFQPELLRMAKENGKLENSYQIPDFAKNNRPERIRHFIESQIENFKAYPFGSDFTTEEENLSLALIKLKSASRMTLALWLFKSLRLKKQTKKKELERMGLYKMNSLKTFLFQRLLLHALL